MSPHHHKSPPASAPGPQSARHRAHRRTAAARPRRERHARGRAWGGSSAARLVDGGNHALGSGTVRAAHDVGLHVIHRERVQIHCPLVQRDVTHGGDKGKHLDARHTPQQRLGDGARRHAPDSLPRAAPAAALRARRQSIRLRGASSSGARCSVQQWGRTATARTPYFMSYVASAWLQAQRGAWERRSEEGGRCSTAETHLGRYATAISL